MYKRQDFPYEEYKAEMAEVFFSHASGGKLAKKPGVEELLKYLKMRGFKIGLASSTREVLVLSLIHIYLDMTGLKNSV